MTLQCYMSGVINAILEAYFTCKFNTRLTSECRLVTLPIVTISTYTGRTHREKDRLAEVITEDVIMIFDVEKRDVIIMYQEEPHGNWYAEGIRLYSIA